jgi:hypothetical protein
MAKHPKRRTSPPVSKQYRFKLRPGDRLVTPTLILTARKLGSTRKGIAKKGTSPGGIGGTVTVECECTKAEPNRPDCKAQSTTSPDGHTTTIKCVKSGGCKSCKTSTTTTTTSVIMA